MECKDEGLGGFWDRDIHKSIILIYQIVERPPVAVFLNWYSGSMEGRGISNWETKTAMARDISISSCLPCLAA